MIYETAYVVKHGAPEEKIKKIQSDLEKVITDAGGEILVNDNWGLRNFAQPTDKGETKGVYYYLMFKAPGTINQELERRMKISESVMKWLTVKLGEDADQEKVTKSYRNPNYESQDKKEAARAEKEKKILSKRRSCYFTINKTEPDWKNPDTYNWFVNEFGKISAARVTGLRPRYQRKVTQAVKRGRMMGLISYLSNEVSERVQQ